MNESIAANVALFAAPLVLLAISWLAVKASTYFAEATNHVKNKTLATVLETVSQTAVTVVASIMEESVTTIKGYSEDGKLTADEARLAFEKGVDDTWRGLTNEMQEVLIKNSASVVDAKRRFIEPNINEAVLATKKVYKEQLKVNDGIVDKVQLVKAKQALRTRR